MIFVDSKNLVFDQVINSINQYIVYRKIYDNVVLENVFCQDPAGVPVIHYNDISKINNTKSKLIIIDAFSEGFNNFDKFKVYPQDKKYIFFSNGIWDHHKFKLQFDYEILHWYYFLYESADRATNYSLVDSFQDQIYNFRSIKKFEFAALIGREKPWRDKLVSLILEKIRFENYVLNYQGQELKIKSRKFDIQYDFDNYSTDKKIYQFYTIAQSIPIDLYNESKVLMVVETTMSDHNEFHLTEKTIKALMTGIPFVLAGSYKFLENLRSLGFKTYNEIWSEEYDNIVDVDQRMNAIIETLNNIHAINWDQEKINKCQLIAYHNKQQLLNINSIMKEQILKIINQFKNYEI